MPPLDDFITDYGTWNGKSARKAIVIEGVSGSRFLGPMPRSLNGVRNSGRRTACGWGMSRPEIERITGGMHVLRALRVPCWYVVLGDSYSVFEPSWRLARGAGILTNA
jgi:hypothetical protein